MRQFTDEKTISIYRQEYSGSPATSSYILSSSATGYLRPLSEEASATNGIQYGYGFNLITEIDIDIQEADIIVIDSVQYNVRGVVSHDRGGITQYKRALMLKSENVTIDTHFNVITEDSFAMLMETGDQILTE